MAAGEADVDSGNIGAWRWIQVKGSDVSCGVVVRELAADLLGLRGLCSSWDSGLLDPVSAGLAGWTVLSGHAVSPVIDEHLAASWPESSCGGFDEWYFCSEVPAVDKVGALCNWGASLREAESLQNVPSGFDVQAQLEKLQPKAVISDGWRAFLISQDQAMLARFAALCRGRRTRG